MTWTQVYDPFGVWWLSTIVAALPVVVLLGLLAIFRVKPHWAAMAGAGVALLAASLVFGMPWKLSIASLGYGAAFFSSALVGLLAAGLILLLRPIGVARRTRPGGRERHAARGPGRRWLAHVPVTVWLAALIAFYVNFVRDAYDTFFPIYAVGVGVSVGTLSISNSAIWRM